MALLAGLETPMGALERVVEVQNNDVGSAKRTGELLQIEDDVLF